MNVLVICAPQTFGYNLGMLSVDLAAYSFFNKYFPDANVEFITLYPHKFAFDDIPYTYKVVENYSNIGKEFLEKDLMFFWGDFLNAWQYREDIIKILVQKKLCEDKDKAATVVRQFLYLSGMPEVYLNKVVLYGGTILFNSAADYQDKTYLDDIKSLLNKSKYALFREAYSAQIAGYFMGSYVQSAQATDAAFLLDIEKLKSYCPERPLLKVPRKKKKIGIFIGRDNFDLGLLSRFITSVGEELEADLDWLDWGGRPFFLDKTKELSLKLPDLNFNKKRQLNSVEKLISLSEEYDFIITDTYHVCVNAWNFGTPAVCLVDNINPALSVNSGREISGRDKRVVLFWTYSADAYIVYSSDLINSGSLMTKAKGIASLLEDKVSSDWVIGLIKSHTAQCKILLKNIVAQVETKQGDK